MIALAWVISVLAALFIGYHYKKSVTVIQKVVEAAKEAQKPVEEESSATIIDPDDLAQQVRFQQDEEIRKLNEL